MDRLQQVWVIDDDPINNIVFKKLGNFINLSDEILDFVSAVDALDKLQIIATGADDIPEAIFLDIRMPIVSGWDFLDRFTGINSAKLNAIPIYMLTSSSDQSDIHQANNHPRVKDYIVKPITVDKLKELKQKHQLLRSKE
ncbi:MAG: response regulator [Cyclobacteriaceae bacterium]